MQKYLKKFAPIFLLAVACSNFEMMKKLNSGTPVLMENPHVVPFDLQKHKIFVKTIINNSLKQYNFILDTGALTCLDENTAQELGLEQGTRIPTPGKAKQAHLVKSKVTISVGKVHVKDFMIPMIDISEAIDSDTHIDGFIGSDFLRFYRITIDYRKQQIVFARTNDSNNLTPTGYKCSFKKPLPIRAPVVECIIDKNIKVNGMIDTGSPFGIVFPLALLEKYEFPDKGKLLESKGVMAEWPFFGKVEKNYLARITRLKIGELKIDNILALYSNPRNVLLGYEFLSQFLITINYPGNEIVFLPFECAQFKKNIFSTGLRPGISQNKVVVKGFWQGSPADNSGIRIGDEILEINGMRVSELSLDKINDILNDDTVTPIELKIRGNDRAGKVVLTKEMLLPNLED